MDLMSTEAKGKEKKNGQWGEGFPKNQIENVYTSANIYVFSIFLKHMKYKTYF